MVVENQIVNSINSNVKFINVNNNSKPNLNKNVFKNENILININKATKGFNKLSNDTLSCADLTRYLE
jgi:hypothetical protein